MAKIDSAYAYLLTTYGNITGSRYDSHKKSELKSVYNKILKTNKDAPLYKIAQTQDLTQFAIDMKENARRIQNVISSLSEYGDDISSVLEKKVATSSDSSVVSVHYVGNENQENKDTFQIEVNKLATPQVNEGNYLRRNGHAFEEGSFSFDLDTPTNSYEFQFNVNAGDNNYDVQSKIARLINQSDVGLVAEILVTDQEESALRITSKQTGLAEGESSIFNIQSGASWNEINTLGIANITSPASNSSFLLNGKEHTSLSNTFTIDRAFELTMHRASEGHPVTIGFKANTDTISDGVDDMLSTYNSMLDVGNKYASAHGNNKLYNDMRSLAKTVQADLENVGIFTDETQHLYLDRDKLNSSITKGDKERNYQTLNRFKSALSRQANKISIDPMNYVNKVIVEYKNPNHNFYAPYASSTYSGMLIDQTL